MSLFSKDECYRGGNKHNFQPRWDEVVEMPNISDKALENILDGIYASDTADVIESMKNKRSTYVHDICVWCGETRNRNHSP